MKPSKPEVPIESQVAHEALDTVNSKKILFEKNQRYLNLDRKQ